MRDFARPPCEGCRGTIGIWLAARPFRVPLTVFPSLFAPPLTARSNNCGAGQSTAVAHAGSGHAPYPAWGPDWQAYPFSGPGLDLLRGIPGLGGSCRKRCEQRCDPISPVCLRPSGVEHFPGHGSIWGKLFQSISRPRTVSQSSATIRSPSTRRIRSRMGRADLQALAVVFTPMVGYPYLPGAQFKSFRGVSLFALRSSKSDPPRRSRTWSRVSFSPTPEHSQLGIGWELGTPSGVSCRSCDS